ncbi:hypothetical protein DM02DRAFT_528752 [Periconia macrospinosa]|uniref:TPR domain-containing protein n=1 Tax=Periconia macrospinosa TaxID=97972 RepID=A0A2V1DNN8_9PLEO|nr:hypothetical protein DM02DRAFT_528752 [Periconia macrospinosa]
MPPRIAWRPNPVAIRQPMSRRQEFSTAKARAFLKEQTRRSPIMFPFALLSVIGLFGWLAYFIPWYYEHVIIRPFRHFPEPVAQKLRRAMFYSRGRNMDMREADRYFNEALQVAAAVGMDQFSDEAMAIKYLMALAFENGKAYSHATKVLESLRFDTERWLEEQGDKHWHDGDRARVLKNLIQAMVKAGQLYSCRYLRDVDLAEKRLTWAVETMLKEVHRRETEGLKQGEGPFMSDEEIGATLEALGTHYETYNSHHLALPLFLRALDYCPKDSCHSVILMNNIATCLAQQPLPKPPPPPTTPTTNTVIPPTPPLQPTRPQVIAQARTWAEKALSHADTIPAENRDEECATGCATATHNLGEFAEMEGRLQEARELYDRASRMAFRAGFKEGSVHAKEGLKRVDKKIKEESK